jgi:hypothetical protein
LGILVLVLRQSSVTHRNFHLTGAIRSTRKTTTHPVLSAILALEARENPSSAARRMSRLVRKTLSFSKKRENHIGAIWSFVHHYNASLA